MPNLLIVDDEWESRYSLREFIQTSEYNYFTVHEADTYEKGILMLKQLKPSILIVEISLPDQNGLEFGEKAKQLEPGISVIILSQLKIFENVQKAINLGFSAYLLKPVLRSELKQIFERISIQSLSTEANYFIHKNEAPSNPDLANPIESSIQFIQQHFKEPITLNTVADSVYLSPSHFSRLFKEEMGVTFVEYLTAFRVEQSKSLLKMTSLPIEVIAHQMGFTSAGYFATIFRKSEGFTPSKYRSLFEKG
ncbi:AraC family transcriptional regulator [Bacillus sp. DTU_2020_1000418_1_SI_GHA_SEK_038]|uniref:response regulator transcription factor n=1 Tax=Bacillus sp. DTU_2020_1000418_1_SI_GHA_SEK_038 TaxID=3077585 RepID=UPI0028EB1E49|nr:AraC family transcriptional regulator [Bacillus sp. DTU_2020_1000418_1_SI_GHA_SEK_038]WNS73651.1 AraC family transcriptional regulator [Bacillus sp. DTU_2020_1000418_1_SI_GHA_SEK_038]